MRALLLVLLAWSTEAGFRMEGYDSGEPGSGPCESHTLSWADAHWTNVQNPHESVDDVACLDFYEDDIPVSMKIDATTCRTPRYVINGKECPVGDIELVSSGNACVAGAPHFDPEGAVCANDNEPDEAYCSYIPEFACARCLSHTFSSSSESKIWMTTYDSHGCGNDVDQVFNFTDGQCRKQETDPWSCFFIQSNQLHYGRCWNIFSVRLSCWDGSHPTSGDDDDAPATASTEVLVVIGVLLILVGVGAGVFVSRRRPAPEAPAVIQMATHVVVDDGRMAKADPESPAPPIVAAAEEVPPPVWT